MNSAIGRPAYGQRCPGADRCPYARSTAIGQRAEGVLRKPEAIALGANGEVYVADQFSFVVQRFSADGRYEGEWGSYGRRSGEFGAIDGLAVDSRGAVYVADSSNDRVQKFDAGGRFITAWGGRGTQPGRFSFGGGSGPGAPPSGAVAVQGPYVYVADTGNHRVQRFDLDGSHATVWADVGGAAFFPRGITATPQSVYVTDEGSRRIFELDPSGRVVASAGGFGTGPGQFSDPFGVAVDGARDVFVADNNNNRVVRLDRQLRYVTAWSATGRSRLSYVRAVAVSPAGRLYVADAGSDLVVMFDPQGRPLGQWGISGIADGELVAPRGVAADPAGGSVVVETFGSRSPIFRFTAKLDYAGRFTRGGGAILGRHFFSPSAVAVAGDGSVWVNDRANGFVRHLSSSGAYLGALGTEHGTLSGSFRQPGGVAVDRTGAVYVADTGHARVLKYSSRGGLLSVWGSAGPGSVLFREPSALAVDGISGDVYVADAAEDRVIKLAPDGRLLTAWGSKGTAPGRFRGPSGIAVDPGGHVFVSDLANDRIQEFTLSGHYLTAWGQTGVRPGELERPGGLSVDCRGDVLVADTQNNRVQVFAGAATPGRCATS